MASVWPAWQADHGGAFECVFCQYGEPGVTLWCCVVQSWTHLERLCALDQLIEACEPGQVRHMMHVIEPQFQRDFISLLPKEVGWTPLEELFFLFRGCGTVHRCHRQH